jgi:hypothetical protein
VSQWINRGTGSAMTLAQTVDAQRPVYANSAINIAQGQILTPANAPAAFDVFVVGTPNALGDWRTLLRSAQGHEMIMEYTSNRFGVYTTNGFNPAGALTWPSVAGLGFARVAASTVTWMSRDGGPMTSTSTALPAQSPAPIMFGGYASAPPSQPWGSIKEVVFLTYNLENSRQMMEGYLAHRHSLAWALPSDHPYKTRSP